MIRLLPITALLISLGALSLPTLHAGTLTYDIDFTATSGNSPTPTGSFTYDTVAQQFDSFTVESGSLDFDLTSSANAPSAFAGCLPSADAAGVYAFLESEGAGCPESERWEQFVDPGIGDASFSFGAPDPPRSGFVPLFYVDDTVPSANGEATFAQGGFSIALASSPEPGTFVLTGGILLPFVFLFRRRRAAPRVSAF